MPDINPGQTEIPNPPDNNNTEPGHLYIAEKPEAEQEEITIKTVPAVAARLPTPTRRGTERKGTAEHLAARRPIPELDAEAPELKQQLAELRSEITQLLTGLRWEGKSVQETADQLIPLLNVGPLLQWKPVLLPFLLEIDRAGNMIPTWLNIIERGDPTDLPPDANPAETIEGRARRFAILMLGYYKSIVPQKSSPLGFAKPGFDLAQAKNVDLAHVLGKLVVNPNTSLYAAESLVRLGTTSAIQALLSALKDAEGWARVDIIEQCLTLKQERFYDILLASSLDRVAGLESYTAIPIYRTIPLENYLRGQVSVHLMQQAALVVNQVFQESMNPPKSEDQPVPVAFEAKLPAVAQALFDGARSRPVWQNAVAIHRLGLLLGRYWAGISRQEIRDARIIDPIYQCLPMMPEVERWMAGPGREVLLTALSDPDEESLMPVVKVLGELREPRATTPLIKYIEGTQELNDREHALALGMICDTLGALGDLRAAAPMQYFLQRVVDIERRSNEPRRNDNLPPGDPDIPGSIVYAAVVRSGGLLGERSVLDIALHGTRDLDPYVRSQSLEAIKRLDPRGDDLRSRLAAREALKDPRENIIRTACQLIIQYRDIDASSALHHVIDTRPELTALAYDTLRQLGQ
jgi:HEAT repeat protein